VILRFSGFRASDNPGARAVIASRARQPLKRLGKRASSATSIGFQPGVLMSYAQASVVCESQKLLAIPRCFCRDLTATLFVRYFGSIVTGSPRVLESGRLEFSSQ